MTYADDDIDHPPLKKLIVTGVGINLLIIIDMHYTTIWIKYGLDLIVSRR